jgi:hypothetical protein
LALLIVSTKDKTLLSIKPYHDLGNTSAAMKNTYSLPGERRLKEEEEQGAKKAAPLKAESK